jgi:hypothetical protein
LFLLRVNPLILPDQQALPDLQAFSKVIWQRRFLVH